MTPVPVLRASGADRELVRWRRAVRRQVRLLIAEHDGIAPVSILWLARSPRKADAILTPGSDAEDRGAVAVAVREGIRAHEARFAALGRAQLFEGRMSFLLVVAGAGECEAWAAPLGEASLKTLEGESFAVYSDLGAWEMVGGAEEVGALLLAGLRDVERS